MAANNILNSRIETDRLGEQEEAASYRKGRGAQFNPRNRFETVSMITGPDGIDEWAEPDPRTTYTDTVAKSLVNKVESPDVGMLYSMNPYAGCEHGCIYCYARNSFEYGGFSAGLDFETRIQVKINAPQLLRQFLLRPAWNPVPLSLSGNTDCYQPAEKKYGLTRKLLEVCRAFRQPVGIITKNAGVLRDLDILSPMGQQGLASVILTVTTQQEALRQVMEPRTTTAARRLGAIEQLRKAGVQAGVMIGPVIPGLNDHEIPALLKSAADAGASFAAYTFVRLNGAVKFLFHDWLQKNFPDRADKVWHGIENGHGGKVNDSVFGRRMRGEGPMAQLVRDSFHTYRKKYGLGRDRLALDCTLFQRPGQQGKLF